MTDELEWIPAAPESAVSTAKPRRHRHVYEPFRVGPEGYVDAAGYYIPAGDVLDNRCKCGAIQDPAASRRGRLNSSRGNAIEREVGKALGLRRVGQYGGPEDLSNELFAAQVKSGGAFSERYWQWLKAVPVTAAQTPLLVVTDAPGPGHKRRAIVVIDLDDWKELHGD